MNTSEMFAAEKLDLVMRDEDFVIYYDGKPLTTSGGVEFAHKNARVLKHLLLKLTLNKPDGAKGLNSAVIFEFLKDRIENGRDFINENFDLLFDCDFVIISKFDKQRRPAVLLDEAIDYLDKNQVVMNLIYWSNSVILEGFRSLLAKADSGSDGSPGIDLTKEGCRKSIKDLYDNLLPGQRAGANQLVLHHANGIVLPLMLVLNIITPSEYANSTLAVRSKQQTKKEDFICTRATVDFGIEPEVFDASFPLRFVSAVHREALKSMEFLRFFGAGQRKISVISELISRGESDDLEFKSTFRWDIRQNKKNPAIEHASLKTMAAFLNSRGGNLLIGVEDDGNIFGVESDGFPNDDKFLLHLWSLIKSSMGQDISPYLKTTLEKIDGKSVCRVHCQPSPKPVFLRQKGFDESFYIRIGPGTGSLEISEALKYISERFGAKV